MPLFLGEDKISRVIMSVESVDGGTNTNDATLSSGAQMLQGVTAYSKGAKYTGTIATVEGATPNISVSSDGLIVASVSNLKGYQAESTIKTTTRQLTTKGETTITPSSANQTAVNSGVYTTGKITVSAVPTETKTITANGTYNPTSGKYYSQVTVNVPNSGIDTSDATATADDIEEGKTAYVNGEKITGTIKSSDLNIMGDTCYFNENNNNRFRILGTSPKKTIVDKYAWVSVSTPIGNFGDATAADVVAGKTFTSSAGLKVTGTATISGSTPTLQTKSITPTESEQTVTPDAGYDGLSSVTVGAISSTYVGSGVPTQGAKTVTPSTSAKTAVSSGTYVTGDVTVDAIPSNYIDTSDADATASDIVANKTAYVNGVKVTGSVAEYTSNQDRFYGTNATTLTANYGSTLYIGVKKPIDRDLLLRRIADNGQVAEMAVLAPANQYGDAIASDVLKGKTFTSKAGLKVSGTFVAQKYYTGTSEPSSSLGNDGDIYLKT